MSPMPPAQRGMFFEEFEPGQKLPPVGRAVFDPQHLRPASWLALGYVVIGRRAIRLDLAERVGALLRQGKAERDAFSCLSLPQRDFRELGGAFRSALSDV